MRECFLLLTEKPAFGRPCDDIGQDFIEMPVFGPVAE